MSAALIVVRSSAVLQRPDADVELVDLTRSGDEHPLPVGLVGTPTYTVGGRIRWLGNPSPQQLLDVVDGRTS